jgi:transposase InsO family protein
VLSLSGLIVRPKLSLAAENLFLRKQLAFYEERGVRPRRLSDPVRLCLVLLAHLFDWHPVLKVVKPATFIGWHRNAFRLFWKWKSRPAGRPAVPAETRALIRRMASENPTWGQAQIAAELLLKIGIRLSPRTVAKYMPKPGARPWNGIGSQSWRTFLQNHAKQIVACDFFTVVTASLKVLYVFVVMEHASRRISHFNVTDHPTAGWTTQQFREALPTEHEYRFLIHDRDSIYSAELDEQIRSMGLVVVKIPARAPKANALCERLIGTIRRECLDLVIPLGEKHVRRILSDYIRHYNEGRPHSSLGPGIPDGVRPVPIRSDHSIAPDSIVRSRKVLGGLRHEYWLENIAA